MMKLSMFLSMMSCARSKIKAFFTKENGEVNIVAIVVLIGVAVILAVVFKDAIFKLLQKMFTSISQDTSEAFKDPGDITV